MNCSKTLKNWFKTWFGLRKPPRPLCSPEAIAHLPVKSQQELQELVQLIVERQNPKIIILFGSYARGEQVNDIHTDKDGITYTYESDYDLLVVVKNEKNRVAREASLENHIAKLTHIETPVSIIIHGQSHLDRELLKIGNFFFSDIYHEGKALYTTGEYELPAPRPLTPKEKHERSQIYYDNWLNSAKGFYRFYENGIAENNLKGAGFQLHQATEHLFVTILLVFTGYKGKTHNLKKLHRDVVVLDSRFRPIFPMSTQEQKDRFDKLVEYYIKTRYTIGYEVLKEDLDYLSDCVKQLLKLTEQLCKEQIEKYLEE